jgi:hypothetical protein
VISFWNGEELFLAKQRTFKEFAGYDTGSVSGLGFCEQFISGFSPNEGSFGGGTKEPQGSVDDEGRAGLRRKR